MDKLPSLVVCDNKTQAKSVFKKLHALLMDVPKLDNLGKKRHQSEYKKALGAPFMFDGDPNSASTTDIMDKVSKAGPL